MDKDEGSNDTGGGGEPEKSKDNDNDSNPEIIEVKEDSQDGRASSPIGVESPPAGSRLVSLFSFIHIIRP